MDWATIVFASLCVVVAAGVAVIFAVVKRQNERVSAMDAKLGIAVQPFWGYALGVVAELLTHPHKRYEESDLLIKKALLEPAVRMSDEDFARLNFLLDERQLDNSPDMRPGEHDAALIFQKTLLMVRREAANNTVLSGFTVVGRQEPEAQKSGEDPPLV